MKIATFNANSIRMRMSIILPWLAANRPDVLCIQETKVVDELFPSMEFESAGYKCVFRGQKSYNGVAILSLHEPEDVRAGFGEGDLADKTRLISAKIDGINVVTAYVPQGYMVGDLKFEYKLDWFKRLRAWFDEHFTPEDPIVWTGDFNVAIEDIDVYNPAGLQNHVCFHPDVRKALKEVMAWGFVDVFRLHCDKDKEYTFWDYRAINTLEKNIGWRLDYIMATKTLAAKSVSCVIDRAPRALPVPSDHTFVVAEFNI